MNNLLVQLQMLFSTMQGNAVVTLEFLGLFWAVHLLNVIFSYRLNYFGIYPRKVFGLIGILFFTFLHGNFNHLFFNSVPLFVLLNFMMLYGLSILLNTSLQIILLGGIVIWLVGRKGIHVGASSLVMGYLGYLLIDAIKHPSIITIVLAGICLYYFGTLLLHLFPQGESDSFEGHIAGFAAGVLTVYFPINFLVYLNVVLV